MTDITFTDASKYLKPKSVVSGEQQTRELSAFIVYAKLHNVDELANAHSREKHVVSILPLESDKNARMQIRAINDEVYLLETIYLPANTSTYKQMEVQLTRQTYELLSQLATCTQHLTVCRYRILDTDMEWRIEEYLSRVGTPHPWVKVIIELDNTDVVIPKLPVSVNEYIYAQDENLTPEDKKKINELETSEWFKSDASNQYIVF